MISRIIQIIDRSIKSWSDAHDERQGRQFAKEMLDKGQEPSDLMCVVEGARQYGNYGPFDRGIENYLASLSKK